MFIKYTLMKLTCAEHWQMITGKLPGFCYYGGGAKN